MLFVVFVFETVGFISCLDVFVLPMFIKFAIELLLDCPPVIQREHHAAYLFCYASVSFKAP